MACVVEVGDPIVESAKDVGYVDDRSVFLVPTKDDKSPLNLHEYRWKIQDIEWDGNRRVRSLRDRSPRIVNLLFNLHNAGANFTLDFVGKK